MKFRVGSQEHELTSSSIKLIIKCHANTLIDENNIGVRMKPNFLLLIISTKECSLITLAWRSLCYVKMLVFSVILCSILRRYVHLSAGVESNSKSSRLISINFFPWNAFVLGGTLLILVNIGYLCGAKSRSGMTRRLFLLFSRIISVRKVTSVWASDRCLIKVHSTPCHKRGRYILVDGEHWWGPRTLLRTANIAEVCEYWGDPRALVRSSDIGFT